MHLLRAGATWQLELRLDGVESRKQAIEMLKARARSVGPGQWVFNIRGWATAQFADDPKPFTRGELDRIAPENPVALQELYYQVFLNSRALVADMNRAGLTSFGVAGCNADVLDIFRAWKAQGHLDVRTFCIGGAAAGSPEEVDRSLQQIETMPTTIDAFLDQIDAVNTEYPIRNLRWALAHVNGITPPQIARMKKLGMYAAVHPWAVINGAIMHEGFGDRARDMPPLASIQDSGIAWGFGTDATAANQYLPFMTLNFAVTGRMPGGVKVIRQTISREDALIAHTRKNAYFVFRENDLGSIQPGKLADIVVLDSDYLTIPADQIKDIKPVITMVGGRIVYDTGSANSTR